MERFAKRKIKIFDYLNCYRVFYVEDSGRKYFVGDYRTKNMDYIAHDVKLWYDSRRKKGKYHVVCSNGSYVPVTDTNHQIIYFDTYNDAADWVYDHTHPPYAGMPLYEVVTDEADN